jgi:putative restriction endonuclease
VAGPSKNAADELLRKLAELRVDRSRGQRRPHKPLLMLCAIQRLLVARQREAPFVELEAQLRPLLDLYAPPVQGEHDPALPYWHLQSDEVWEIPGAAELERGVSGFPRKRALRASLGRIPQRFADALSSDPQLAERAIQVLLDRHFEPSLHDDLRAAIGMDGESEFDGSESERVAEPTPGARDEHAGLGTPRRTRDPNFRLEVLAAYDHRCAVTGFQALLAGSAFCLEAAHVHWHSQGGPSTVDNGLALTPTLHKLFDHGAWSIDDDRRVVVSRHFSGSDGALAELRSLHGRPLRSPAPGFPPLSMERIRWHREPRLGGVFRTPALGIA